MAIFRGTLRSKTLGMDTSVQVVIPFEQQEGGKAGKPYHKTLYLLHGLKQNADAWLRYSEAERFAEEMGYVLVAPEVHRSYYTDMKLGMHYFTYITQELPEVIQKVFRIAHDRDHTFVAGLSMGGYGAMKCALSRPDLYGGAMCFSSAFFRLEEPEKLTNCTLDELRAVLGCDLKRGEEDDLSSKLAHYPPQEKKPLLYLACGTEDFLYDHNIRMCCELERFDFPFAFEQWEGAHNWVFWNTALQKAMKYISSRVDGSALA